MLKNKYFYSFIFLVSVAKLFLVAGNEIIAVPYDSEQYVRQAAEHLYYLAAAPGYPFWLALSHLSGVPQRIAIEIIFLLSSLVFAVWLKRAFGPPYGVIAFGLLALSPATYFMFDYALSDGFYACLSIISIAFSGLVVFSESRVRMLWAAVALGVSLGWMALSRNEDPLLFCWVFLTVLLLAVYQLKKDLPIAPRVVAANVISACAIIAAPAIALVQAVNLVHLKNSGVFSRTLAGLPGHTRFLHNLAAIDAEEKPIRYVPITSKARSLAYMQSPTLDKYRAVIEDRDSIFQKTSRENGVPLGEIGAGWIWHVFNVAVLDGRDAVAAENEYEKINAELEAGFSSGRLKKKFILHSFATSPISDILLRLPIAAWEVAKKSFQTYPQGKDLAYEKELFDTVTWRRAALIGTGYHHTVQGWALMDSPEQKIKAIVSVEGVEKSSVLVSYTPRIDVVRGFEKSEGRTPAVIGFKLSFNSPAEKMGGLVYLLEDGTTIATPDMPIGAKKFDLNVGPHLTIHQGIDFVDTEAVARKGFRHRVQVLLSSLANSPGVSAFLLIGLIVLGMVSIGLRKNRRDKGLAISLFSLLVFGLFVLRILFYAVLESEAWAVEVRYMLAANFMATMLIAVWATCCLSAVHRIYQKRSAALG